MLPMVQKRSQKGWYWRWSARFGMSFSGRDWPSQDGTGPSFCLFVPKWGVVNPALHPIQTLHFEHIPTQHLTCYCIIIYGVSTYQSIWDIGVLLPKWWVPFGLFKPCTLPCCHYFGDVITYFVTSHLGHGDGLLWVCSDSMSCTITTIALPQREILLYTKW
jgi:hypothetical protein